MNGGYTGRILWVDLTRRKVESRELDQDEARKYIGGVGLAAKIVWDNTGAGTEPLSPANPLIFMTGPLTGTIVPSNSRYIVAALSPLTGIWGEAHSGGSWAYELKHAGFDGLVLQGQAKTPVYLWINDGVATLEDASHVWGKGVFESSEVLQSETDRKASVACIGPSGEKLVRIACIINEGQVGRAAARCGLGAVMGSKRVKAVVVRGTKGLAVNNREGLRENVTKYFQKHPVVTDKEGWGRLYREFYRVRRSSGTRVDKNFSGGEMPPGFMDAIIERQIGADWYYCKTCRSSCTSGRLIRGRRNVEAEFLCPMGTSCRIYDIEALQQGFDLCQDFGIDAISAGGVMSLAFEAFEKGLITEADTDNIKLTWGNIEAMLPMLRKIAERREGLGELLGEGVKRASERLGGLAREYAMHSKGLEFAMFDPRSSNGMALLYATGSRGADHLSAHGVLTSNENRYKVEGQGEIVARGQDLKCLVDSLTSCVWMPASLFARLTSEKPEEPEDLVEWLNLVTGSNMDVGEFLKAGERIFNLKRMINVRRGISRKDDLLPPRILTSKRGGTSDSAENLPHLGAMLNEYYSYREWSEEGIPTKKKLTELGLEECLSLGR